MKIHEVTKVGNQLRGEYGSEDFEQKISNYANKKGMEIKVLDETGRWRYPLKMFESIVKPKMLPENFDKFFGELDRQNLRFKVYTVRYPNLEDPSIVYAGYLGNTNDTKHYLYINTVLKPVDATIDVIKRFLIIVSILALFSGLFIAYFVSKRLSRPLMRMSNTAKRLAQGNYDVKFTKGSYTEMDDLADTLNYAKNELTKTIEMRKDLIANVSHDLKTPLTVIKSYGEMIRDISGEDEMKRQEHIQTIINEADHLTDLVNDLLDLSKLESNLEDVKKEEFDLVSLTERVLQRIRILKKATGFDIQMIHRGDTKVLGDIPRLEQVVYNLIINGINYSGSNKKIKILIQGDEEKTEFHCIDKGIGIVKEDQEDIWERFYRVRNNHTRPQVGTGLGLYIVKSILTFHQYDYGVHSTLGEGSDFYFIYYKNKK
ncbi:MAG: HAMP domain-containing sensor histidine kinase [Tissierellia bacterium]|nr:HAMP domain-containing sensor histidine kinase [Tissierellia bacterium]